MLSFVAVNDDFRKRWCLYIIALSRVTGQEYKETEPKTKTSRRRIVHSDVALEALVEHGNEQEQMKIEACDRWYEHGRYNILLDYPSVLPL